MRAAKKGDSPSDYPRDVYPRRLRRQMEHEAEIRRLTDERWQRKVLAALACPEPVEDPDFPGCVW